MRELLLNLELARRVELAEAQAELSSLKSEAQESKVRDVLHAAVAKQVIAEFPWLAGNLLHDTHTAVLMREHGVGRICTRDADFRRFAFLEVVEPH